MTRTNRLLVTAAVAFSVMMVGTTAQAHTANVYFLARWQTGQSVPYLFAPDFPTGAFQSRVLDGVAQWRNRAGSAEPKFWNAGTATTLIAYTTCNPSFNTPNHLHWMDLDFHSGATVGLTSICYNGADGRIYSFQMAFDSDRDWYTGTGDANDGLFQMCIPSCQIDFWSIATHEMGHAHGFTGAVGGHFDGSDGICPNSDARQTMCAGYTGGTERIRTIETHDIHTFQAAY